MTLATLPELQPGELLVRILRGELTIPPDHLAIARANRTLKNWGTPRGGEYRGGTPAARQRECLEGAA
jgi:hypothetical protein